MFYFNKLNSNSTVVDCHVGAGAGTLLVHPLGAVVDKEFPDPDYYPAVPFFLRPYFAGKVLVVCSYLP